jgi:hypothetical protein
MKLAAKDRPNRAEFTNKGAPVRHLGKDQALVPSKLGRKRRANLDAPGVIASEAREHRSPRWEGKTVGAECTCQDVLARRERKVAVCAATQLGLYAI